MRLSRLFRPVQVNVWCAFGLLLLDVFVSSPIRTLFAFVMRSLGVAW